MATSNIPVTNIMGNVTRITSQITQMAIEGIGTMIARRALTKTTKARAKARTKKDEKKSKKGEENYITKHDHSSSSHPQQLKSSATLWNQMTNAGIMKVAEKWRTSCSKELN